MNPELIKIRYTGGSPLTDGSPLNVEVAGKFSSATNREISDWDLLPLIYNVGDKIKYTLL